MTTLDYLMKAGGWNMRLYYAPEFNNECIRASIVRGVVRHSAEGPTIEEALDNLDIVVRASILDDSLEKRNEDQLKTASNP